MGFQIMAAAILLAFYGCYFTKMILQKKRGIQTDQMGKGKTGFVKRIEIALKLASHGRYLPDQPQSRVPRI